MCTSLLSSHSNRDYFLCLFFWVRSSCTIYWKLIQILNLCERALDTEFLVIFPTFSELRPRLWKASLPFSASGIFFYFIVPWGSVLCARILHLTQCFLCVWALSSLFHCGNTSTSVSEMRKSYRIVVASNIHCFLPPCSFLAL